LDRINQQYGEAMKKCTSCKEEKPYDDFYQCRGYTDGYRSQCKNCIKSHMAEYRKSNVEKVRGQAKINSQTFRDNHVVEFCKDDEKSEM